MAKWTLTSIVGSIILLSILSYTLYHSDYKYILASLDKDVFILDFDVRDKVEIMTKSSVCDYALFRISKDQLSAKCGWRRVLDSKWYLEYYKTYGTDEWVRLQRKPRLISLDISEIENGYIVKKITPYYATKSRSGTAGNLIETYHVTPDKIKLSLKFETDYDNRKWRVIWHVDPNVEVVEDQIAYLKLDKQTNIFFSDELFDYRIDDDAFYKVQDGSFEMDPLIEFGNLTARGTMGTFKYGYCDECDNLGNVSFKDDSSAFTATYESGWEFAKILRQPDNMTSLCEDNVGAGYCELSIRNGSEIVPANESMITRCIFNQTGTCMDSRSATGKNFSYVAGALNNFDAILVNESDFLYLGINTSTGDGINVSKSGTNYTLNLSKGSLEMMVTFK